MYHLVLMMAAAFNSPFLRCLTPAARERWSMDHLSTEHSFVLNWDILSGRVIITIMTKAFDGAGLKGRSHLVGQ